MSRHPSLAPLASLLPFVASLRPVRPSINASIVPRTPGMPVINEMTDGDAASSPPPGATTPGGTPMVTSRASRALWLRHKLPMIALPVAALGILGGAFFLDKGDSLARHTTPRAVGTPTLKETMEGGHVRWHRDAIDVVLDDSFTDLAGHKLFGQAVDAWRKTGAVLPSVSTKEAKNRQIGYSTTKDNENVVVFAPFGWAKANGALAITVLTFDEGTGKIVDGDMLINGGGRFFAVFSNDQSNGDATSIDGNSATSTASTSGSLESARYDVQSVVTHELGHFFGLGEDYDDTKATMYVSTRHGEINKRVVTKGEGDVISALYAETEPAAAPEPASCSRSQVARGNGASTSWMGFIVAGLGLTIYAAARRARLGQSPVRIAQNSRATRRAQRVGGWLTVIGLVTSLSPPTVEAATDSETATRGDAEVQIVGSTPRWVDGIVETDLTYRVTTCHVGNCPEGDQHIVAYGGKIDGLTQVVGPFAVPAVGARVNAKLRESRALLKALDPVFKP